MPAPTTPPSMTPVPTPAPVRNDRTTFSSRVDALVTWLVTFVTELVAALLNCYNNAVSAYNSAADALTYKNAAAASETNSAASAVASAASAVTALNAPGTSAASTTSLTIDAASKTLTIQPGKLIVPGMYVVIAKTSAPSNSMTRVVNTYDSVTGVLTVLAGPFDGSGTHADWTISLSAPMTPLSAGKLYFHGQL